MDPSLKAIAEQVPALLVLAWVVVQFLRHMTTLSKEFIDRMLERDKYFHEIATEMRDALNKNTSAMGDISSILRNLNENPKT